MSIPWKQRRSELRRCQSSAYSPVVAVKGEIRASLEKSSILKWHFNFQHTFAKLLHPVEGPLLSLFWSLGTCPTSQLVHRTLRLARPRSKSWRHISKGVHMNMGLGITFWCDSSISACGWTSIRSKEWSWSGFRFPFNFHGIPRLSHARHNTSHSDLFEKSELRGRALEAWFRLPRKVIANERWN